MSNINQVIFEFLVDVGGGTKFKNNKTAPTLKRSLSASKSLQLTKNAMSHNGFNPLSTSVTKNSPSAKINMDRFKKSLYHPISKSSSKPGLFSKFGKWAGTPFRNMKNWYNSQFYD